MHFISLQVGRLKVLELAVAEMHHAEPKNVARTS
jgi:hypothetical protein